MRTAIVGAGIISEIYLKNMTTIFPDLEVVAICASHLDHAEKRASQFRINACTYEEILADDSIELIVNLTPAPAHYEIIKKALLAGKHVYTEKTLTAELSTAKELVKLADERHLYLGSAPDTFLGSALQTARESIDSGMLGDVTSFAISANRDNNVLLTLFSFLRLPGSGICMDYGVYYMTALVSLLGPVARTAAIVKAPYKTHRNFQTGEEMDTPNESQVSAILELKSGVHGTFKLDADSALEDQAFFAIYGTKGVLYLTNPDKFGGQLRFLPTSKDFDHLEKPVPLAMKKDYTENSRGIGPADMAKAIRTSSKSRVDKQMAYHVMEVLCKILESGEAGTFLNIESVCTRPEPLY